MLTYYYKASRACDRIKNNVTRSKNIIELKETHNEYDLSEEERSKCHRQIERSKCHRQIRMC